MRKKESKTICVEFNSIDELRILREAIFYTLHSQFLFTDVQLDEFRFIDMYLLKVINNYEQIAD